MSIGREAPLNGKKPGPPPGCKVKGRKAGTPNKTTMIIRDIILSDKSGDVLLQAFDCWKTGYRTITNPDTGETKSVELTEKGAIRCLEIVIDRVYPRLQSITYKPEDGTESLVPMKVEISVVDCRKQEAA